VKKMVYLRLAIRHGTNKALDQLLDIGWDVNGPFWAYFMTPYRLSVRMELEARREIKYHAPADWDTQRWGDLNTHRGVFEEYRKQQEKIHDNYAQLAKRNSASLRERGGRMPSFVLWFGKPRIYLCAKVLYVLIYAVFLPLTLAFTTGPYWNWTVSTGHKLFWMYIWSLAAVVSPPIVFFEKHPSFFTGQHILKQTLLSIQLILQHLVPLFVVIFAEAPPGLTGYLIPFCVVAPEAGLVMAWSLILISGYLLGLGVDLLWALILFPWAKEFSAGPFGLL
jgi:hypothetical protein